MKNPSQKRSIAFFDFDGTLAEGDSLWPFLVAARGWAWCAGAFLLCLPLPLLAFAAGKNWRTAVKAGLLRLTLGGLSLEEAARAAGKMRSWPKWIEKNVATLRKHHEAGHLVVIATGSLNLYMPTILRDVLPYDELLCTEMEMKGNVLTGRMASGNCVRERKAQRVAEYIVANGPFEESWAYGNAPHDLPMMEVVKTGIVV